MSLRLQLWSSWKPITEWFYTALPASASQKSSVNGKKGWDGVFNAASWIHDLSFDINFSFLFHIQIVKTYTIFSADVINKNLLINLLLLRLFPITVFWVCMLAWSFIKSACFLSYLLVSLFRLIFSSTILDHIPWRGKGGVFHHSCVSPRTEWPMGIPQCHLLRGTRTTESAAGLFHCILPSSLVPRPLLPLRRSQHSLFPCQFLWLSFVLCLW